MPLAKWALWKLRLPPGGMAAHRSLSKDSEELCKIRNPRPHKGPANSPQYSPALAQKIVMAGNSPAITLRSLVYSAGALFPLDLHHFIGLGAARRDHLDLGALLFSNQGARQRRGDGNLALLSVRLWLADELPHRFFVGVFVD